MKEKQWKTSKPGVQNSKQGNGLSFFILPRRVWPGKGCATPAATANQREGQGMHSLTKNSPALLPFNHTPPYIYHIPSLALLSNPKDSSSDSNNLSSLTITTGEQKDRKVLQDKWRGSNFWCLPFKRGGEEGCVHGEWKYSLPPRCPIRPIFCKTRCVQFAY